MSRYDQRLEKLEQQTGTQGQSMRIVFVNDGETEEQAVARTGADRTNTLFVGWRRPDQTAPQN